MTLAAACWLSHLLRCYCSHSARCSLFLRETYLPLVRRGGTAPYFNRCGCVAHLRARRLGGRSDADRHLYERHCHNWRSGYLRRSPRHLRGVILVCAVARGNGDRGSHVTSHALVQTVVRAYSLPEFHGRPVAIFHMTQVVLVVGGRWS
jgi:hypothetical protein